MLVKRVQLGACCTCPKSFEWCAHSNLGSKGKFSSWPLSLTFGSILIKTFTDNLSKKHKSCSVLKLVCESSSLHVQKTCEQPDTTCSIVIGHGGEFKPQKTVRATNQCLSSPLFPREGWQIFTTTPLNRK